MNQTRQVLKWLAPVVTCSTLSAILTVFFLSRKSRQSPTSTEARHSLSETMAMPMDDGSIALLFPDGREVRNLSDLSEWQQMIEDDDSTSEEGKHLAWVMANSIRAKFN